jgi:hypothetical protein
LFFIGQLTTPILWDQKSKNNVSKRVKRKTIPRARRQGSDFQIFFGENMILYGREWFFAGVFLRKI